MVSWWSFLILCLFETRFGIIQFSGFSFQVSFYGFLWVFLRVWELFCVIWKSWVVDLEISNTHQACNWISEIDARRAFQRNPSWSRWQDLGKFGAEIDHLAVLLSCACSTCLKIFLKDKKVWQWHWRKICCSSRRVLPRSLPTLATSCTDWPDWSLLAPPCASSSSCWNPDSLR